MSRLLAQQLRGGYEVAQGWVHPAPGSRRGQFGRPEEAEFQAFLEGAWPGLWNHGIYVVSTLHLRSPQVCLPLIPPPGAHSLPSSRVPTFHLHCPPGWPFRPPGCALHCPGRLFSELFIRSCHSPVLYCLPRDCRINCKSLRLIHSAPEAQPPPASAPSLPACPALSTNSHLQGSAPAVLSNQQPLLCLTGSSSSF